MPIYIAVEVARRELEGRLLLGLVAAERGHDVVLGKIPHAALLAEEMNGWRLPPGIVHLKSAPSTARLAARFDGLRARGSLVTVQDEEHGLSAQQAYATFGEYRFPPEAVALVDRIMAWGPLDTDWLRNEYPERQDAVIPTGSPRIDLWRPDLIDSAHMPTPSVGHILFASSTSPFSHNPFWVTIQNGRAGTFGAGFQGDADPRELARYDFMADAFRYVKHAVVAVRRLAMQHPERTIVVRPHHFEPLEAWHALIGDYANVEVRGDGPARSWVRGAAAVIFGGSTLGLEVSVAQRPAIAFSPEGLFDRHPANGVGIAASDIDGLCAAVAAVIDRGDAEGPSRTTTAFLNERLVALDGPLAADRIVDEWERLMTPTTRGRVERITRRRAPGEVVRRPLRALRDVVRGKLPDAGSGRAAKGPYAMEIEHKFPSLDVDALRADAARLAAHLGRFQDVEIIQIGDREVLLRAAGR